VDGVLPYLLLGGLITSYLYFCSAFPFFDEVGEKRFLFGDAGGGAFFVFGAGEGGGLLCERADVFADGADALVEFCEDVGVGHFWGGSSLLGAWGTRAYLAGAGLFWIKGARLPSHCHPRPRVARFAFARG
jgi:hypothetical protein